MTLNGISALFANQEPRRGFASDRIITSETFDWMRRSRVESDCRIISLYLSMWDRINCVEQGLALDAGWVSPVYVSFLSCLHKSNLPHRGRGINVLLLLTFVFMSPSDGNSNKNKRK